MVMHILRRFLFILTSLVGLAVGVFELRDYLTKDEPAEYAVSIPLSMESF